MMRFSRQASSLLALSLLTSAATAYAEGAWVLWERWFSQEIGDSPDRRFYAVLGDQGTGEPP
jgi:hypothetical protein